MSSAPRPGLIDMAERLLAARGVRLCVETFGDPASPAVLLIGGMTASMDWWEVGFCERLAAAGRYVIRYDHRDTGRSESSPRGKPAYTSEDLATDPLRVLDALGVERAHVVGLSMGGGIAQVLAARHPDRLLSITVIATTAAGTRSAPTRLPGAEPRIAALFDDPPPEPDWADRAAVVEYLVEEQRAYAGPIGFDAGRVRGIAGTVVDRTTDVAASVTNHGVAAGPTAEFRLADIAVPTLVMHGTADPLLPFPHGEALAAEIPGATFVPLEGMGHEVPPPPLWDVAVAAIVRHTAG